MTIAHDFNRGYPHSKHTSPGGTADACHDRPYSSRPGAMIKTEDQIVLFIALLGFFFAVGGFSPPPDSPGHSGKHTVRAFGGWVRIVLCYVVGASLAIWGDQTTGLLDP